MAGIAGRGLEEDGIQGPFRQGSAPTSTQDPWPPFSHTLLTTVAVVTLPGSEFSVSVASEANTSKFLEWKCEGLSPTHCPVRARQVGMLGP